MLYLYWLVVHFELMKAWCHHFEDARDEFNRGIMAPVTRKQPPRR